MAIVLAPYIPLALLAHANPPLPPPITKKSHSFCMGAMMPGEEEKWRVTADNLLDASLDPVPAVMEGRKTRGRSEVDSLTALRTGGAEVRLNEG